RLPLYHLTNKKSPGGSILNRRWWVKIKSALTYDNPEYFIDQILIDYVGEDKFNQWMDENNPEDRTLTNFKKHFNVTDKDIEKLNKEAKEKAEKKNKMKKSNNK
ncbi:hypothetical protein QO009_003108, partial [Brevibacillus aydinogluensis]|nr:hypothetical protein [Brevibacillus aydinogluensis]